MKTKPFSGVFQVEVGLCVIFHKNIAGNLRE